MAQNQDLLFDQALSIKMALGDQLLATQGISGQTIDDIYSTPDGSSSDFEFIVVGSESSKRLIMPALFSLAAAVGRTTPPAAFLSLEVRDYILCAFDPNTPGYLAGAVVVRPYPTEGHPVSLADQPWHNEEPGNSWVLNVEIVSTMFPAPGKDIKDQEGYWNHTGVRGAIAAALGSAISWFGMMLNDRIAALQGERIWLEVQSRISENISDHEADELFEELLPIAMDLSIDFNTEGRLMMGLDQFRYV